LTQRRVPVAAERHRVDETGWVERLPRIESPNSDERPAATAIELVVIHGISLPPGEFGGDHVARLFTNSLDCEAHPYFRALKGLRVSAHFLVRRDASVLQFVSCARRAWHAGVSCWQGRSACNDYSIGIEFEGTDDTPYERSQYRAGARLLDALRAAYPIRWIVGHSDIAPGRKTDPGPHFDWLALRQPRLLLAR
jgi:N-acetyl-anhydromuramoyl-L-alanine amidase